MGIQYTTTTPQLAIEFRKKQEPMTELLQKKNKPLLSLFLLLLLLWLWLLVVLCNLTDQQTSVLE